VAFAYPSPMALPGFDPPMRAKMAPGTGRPRVVLGDGIDIGAFEHAGGSVPVPTTAAAGEAIDLATVSATSDGTQAGTQTGTQADEPPEARKHNVFVAIWQDLRRWFDGVLRRLS
jgi:hypothetical protein